MNFKLTFTERHLINRTTPVRNIDVPLEWNQVAHYTFPGDGVLNWTAVYTDFNNKQSPFGTTNSDPQSQYMKVRQVADRTWTFALYPFSADIGADVTARSATQPPGGSLRDLLGNLDLINVLFNENVNPVRAQGFAALTQGATAAYARSIADIPTTLTGINVDELFSALSIPQATRSNQSSTQLTTSSRAGALTSLRAASPSTALR